jgi:hypothetical protein
MVCSSLVLIGAALGDTDLCFLLFSFKMYLMKASKPTKNVSLDKRASAQ